MTNEDQKLLKEAEKTFGFIPDTGPLEDGLVRKKFFIGVIYLEDGRVIRNGANGAYFEEIVRCPVVSI